MKQNKRARLWPLFLAGFSLLIFANSLLAARAVATAHPAATQAGLEILKSGGNAFDAAVAVSAALAVVEPYGSGIGGGGFWLLHRAADDKRVMIDGRETAPLAADRDMYLDDKGEVVPGLSIDGPLAAGIPGEPAALVHIAERYGRLPLSTTLAPAIRLAEQGFAVEEHYRRMATFRLKALQASPAAAEIFLKSNQVPEEDFVVRQPDLADTLRAMAERGHEGFYAGEVAQKLVDGVRAAGGIWTREDLAAYKVIEREPLVGTYKGFKVTTVAPPSSGGIVLLTMLNILGAYDLEKMSFADRQHHLIEAMRLAYRDRAEYLGDPDFVSMPVERLIHPWYAEGLRVSIHPDAATVSEALRPVVADQPQGRDTTHFSILDDEGNRVAATLSINYPFGASFVPPGTGVLLNDEMDDFSSRPGTPNVYGLVGAEANAIEPGKRMLSSMTPTLVDGPQGSAILGTPGGSRIITMVLQGILALSEGKSVEEWVSLPRIHHQYLPDRVELEPNALDDAAKADLDIKGHTLTQRDGPWGNMQAIHVDADGKVRAASDPRGLGAAQVVE